MSDELFKISQVAEHYKVSEETIRRWIRTKQIPYTPVGPFNLKRLKLTDPITQENKNDGKGTTETVRDGSAKTNSRRTA